MPVTDSDDTVTINSQGTASGDVNCDNAVNSIDGLFILQYDVGSRAGSDQCPPPADTLYLANCDVSGDGDCNSVDALFILQCDVGIANPFCPTAIAAQTWLRNDGRAGSAMRIDARWPGQIITVPVVANLDDANLGAASLALHFDPASLRPVACTADPNQAFDLALCQRSAGAIRLNLISIEGAEGRIALANVTFRNLGSTFGSTALELEQRVMVDSQGNAISSPLDKVILLGPR
jgi:hypothetical protein